ncbi:non-homologous end-joining DNA ligase [Emcibacter sp. SYSU 3D8]|uniref:non-homologous end-joining DNA ligase n=1 Tax=Emcibacter sp. SYSU 3D8 TaxID=3133969 RepID=UPI0031FEA981
MVAVAGVTLSHPDKVLYADQGVTKLDLARYLHAVSPRMLPYVSRRLVSLVRCPEGAAKQCFFQKHGTAGLAPSLKPLPVREKDGGEDDYLYLTDETGLVRAAQMGVLEFHIWGSMIDDIEKPNRIVFDLDPDPSVSFESVKQAALRVRDILDALGLRSFPLLTGGKGIHVVTPIRRRHEWPVIKEFAKSLALRMSEDQPDKYLATMSKAKRKGRIFIDYLRNERGSTAIAPYSPRARKGAPVAWPVTWESLDGTHSAALVHIGDAVPHLAEPDPWADYVNVRQSLGVAALRALGVDANG